MTIKDELNDELKEAMRTHDRNRINVVAATLDALTKLKDPAVEIAKRKGTKPDR